MVSMQIVAIPAFAIQVSLSMVYGLLRCPLRLNSVTLFRLFQFLLCPFFRPSLGDNPYVAFSDTLSLLHVLDPDT